jgi:D-serine deaminase-like pyridoxal phosphate-dependent protein
MVSIFELPTPAFVIDLEVAKRNCDRMREKAAVSGVALRPHVKTHKTIEGARLQLGTERGPVTVSTLAEAEFFADHGFDDITWAVPVAVAKADRIVDLTRRVERFQVLVDHPRAVSILEEAARAQSVRLRVFLEVDCGDHRTGIDPEDDQVLEVLRMIDASKALYLAGVLTHAGHSYRARTRDEILAVSEEEVRAVNIVSERARSSEIGVAVRSIGSTPTAAVVERFSGVDEVRPGNYVFFDAFQAKIGTCEWQDCAATVVATVIAVHPGRRQMVVDAGALALSKDRGAEHLEDRISYGVVLDQAGHPRGDLRVTTLSQEHGKIEADTAAALESVRIGDIVRIIPNHSCLTAALFEQYHILRGSDVVGEWRPVRGW